MTRTIGILVGSTRPTGNNVGLLAFLRPLLSSALSPSALVLLDPYTSSIGPLVDPIIPQGVRDPSRYQSPRTKEWSAAVAACDAFVVVTPQWNWGIPGTLKEAMDHLFWEWVGKPVVLITYGGHGGGKCAAHLRDVMGGGLKMKVVGGVEITLPEEYIKGGKKIGQGEDEWLAAYEGKVTEVSALLAEALVGPVA